MAGRRNSLGSNLRDSLKDPIGMRLGYQLRRASMVMTADLAAKLAPLDLRPTEATILLLVGANPGCRQGEIGELLGIKRANMVPLVARVVGVGLVDRARADGRTHSLTLTGKGVAKVAAVKKALDRHEASFLSRLNGKSLRNLLNSLAVLRGESGK